NVTGVQTCALPICTSPTSGPTPPRPSATSRTCRCPACTSGWEPPTCSRRCTPPGPLRWAWTTGCGWTRPWRCSRRAPRSRATSTRPCCSPPSGPASPRRPRCWRPVPPRAATWSTSATASRQPRIRRSSPIWWPSSTTPSPRRRASDRHDATVDCGRQIAAPNHPEACSIALNTGAEAYATGSGAVHTLVAELCLEQRIVAPREGLGSRVVSDAGVHPSPGASVLGIPGHPLAADVRAVLGTVGALRASIERLLPASFGARDGATVAEVVRRRLGRRVLEQLVAPVVGGVQSADPATLEFAAASPALSRGLAEHG